MENLNSESMKKKVKVRINVAGKRYVGFVNVFHPITRVSDVLNNEEKFITLFEVDAIDPLLEKAHLVINKKQIVFVQALEEFSRNYKGIHEGRFVGVKIRTIDLLIEGNVFQPRDLVNQTFSALLSSQHYFLNVKDVVIPEKNEKYAFLAIGSSQICSLEYNLDINMKKQERNLRKNHSCHK